MLTLGTDSLPDLSQHPEKYGQRLVPRSLSVCDPGRPKLLPVTRHLFPVPIMGGRYRPPEHGACHLFLYRLPDPVGRHKLTVGGEPLAFSRHTSPSPLIYPRWTMPPDNSTASDYHAVEVNTPALSIIQDSTINAGDTMVEIALLSLLFGEQYAHLVSELPSHTAQEF